LDAINLALEAGRKLQRKQTGFIHYCHQSEDLTTHDTIPVLENALFALSLFRTRLAENVLEGKALIQRLLAFEVEGNFPTYLHAYPHISDPYLNLRLLPIFFWITVDFGHVIGNLKQELEACIERILKQPKDANWAKFRLDAFNGQVGALPQNIYDWSEALISLQIAEKKGASIEEPIREAFKHWHPDLCLYVGPAIRRNQEGYFPELTLFDLFMCQWQKKFSARTAKIAPIHLHGALIRPLGFDLSKEPMPIPHVHYASEEECRLVIAWEEHTFVLADHFFLNYHPDHQLFVNGVKANTFRQNDLVEIRSKGLNIQLQFSAQDGLYMGHILRGNRPSQHHCKGENEFAAFDWQFEIRTIQPGCSPIIANIHYTGASSGASANAGESMAIPIACMPLST